MRKVIHVNIEQVKCETNDLATENAKKLLALFPECESGAGEVDFDKLRQCLSSKVVEGNVERYDFTWPGKRAAKAAASAPTTKTLRPCREESVDFDTTGNLYIEGDNLEVLKLLQSAYAGRVKMIYIDPPYNTGHDFVYRDRFSLTKQELESEAGVFDEDGNRFQVNDSAEARYHSNWCSMMYPRLKLARNLLRDDGVIFISIDDNEVTNLRKLCDEVFGERNFVAQCVWQKIHSTKNDAQYLSENHEYILMYAKVKSVLNIGLLPRTAEMNERYTNPDNDPKGPWQSGDLVASGERTTGHYIVKSPMTGKEFDVPQGKHWVYAEENLKELVAKGQIYFGVDGNAFPRKKRYLSQVQDGRTSNTLWLCDEVGHNQSAAREVKALFNDEKYFDFPKPVELVCRMLRLGSIHDSLILDFFSGSATTAHAVMQLNAEDGGNRKFILVQLPEACAEDSEAAKTGYKNICEIGKERIKRAGKKIAEANATTAPNLDTGFRVLKLDTSSLHDTSSTVSEIDQLNLKFERVRSDRTPEDLLFQMLLETRIALSEPIEKRTVAGNEVFFVSGTALVACLDKAARMTTGFFVEIAKSRPAIAFFREDAIADDSTRTNLQQVFDQFSPTTSVKVI